MNYQTWRKELKDCPYKTIDASRPQQKQNILCSFCIAATRCTFKNCWRKDITADRRFKRERLES